MMEMRLCIDFAALRRWWAEDGREILCGAGILAILFVVGVLEGRG
ncbi:MAG TPA: hypothetical protein VMX94_12005 [Armatimonadota bacterium]|nr:hypothetical protein [Armatimonadota bacterium]